MKILFAVSECTPFFKSGGLADVAGSLPEALKRSHNEICVVMPKYKVIPQQFKDQMEFVESIYIDLGWRKQYCGIFKLELNGILYYFIDNEFYFNGDKPYGYIHEDSEKFAFFSKAALSFLQDVNFKPDIVHCHDWQTALIPVFLKEQFCNNDFYRGIKTVLTIHNLKFQGIWNLDTLTDATGLSKQALEFGKDANILKAGLVYCDAVTTVSETYAKEILTPWYGENLDRLLSSMQEKISGIVNGISYNEYNPNVDELIYEKYNKRNYVSKKKANKLKLQEEFGLEQNENTFTIGVVSRLTDQKGFDLISRVVDNLCCNNIQIVVLGSGDIQYENMLHWFSGKYPGRFGSYVGFSNALAHKIYAGCDAFLMPSAFEPCGLSQIISMRYGTLPIVRETGGLKDTVIPYNEYTGEGTGFSFANYNAHEMEKIIFYAKSVYEKRSLWNALVKNAMNADFSWNVSSQKYLDLYNRL